MSVERWAVHFTHNPKTGRNDYEGMVRHPVGAYVAYADYKALTAELEAARRDAAEWREHFIHVSAMRYMDAGMKNDGATVAARRDAAIIDAAIAQTVALVPVPVKEGKET